MSKARGPKWYPHGIAFVVGLLALFATAKPVYADRVDDLIKQLRSADAKLRLSAALNLGKVAGDKRVIGPLVEALDDTDKTVRGIAAAALGRVVTQDVDGATRKKALTELERVAKADPDSLVRTQAGKSAAAIKALAPAGTGTGGGQAAPAKSIYVSIGPMTDNSKSGASMLPVMKKTVETTLKKKAPQMNTNFTAQQLKQAGNPPAFYVDGTLKSLKVRTVGSMATVSCDLSLYIATYPQMSAFAFANGGASVEDSAANVEGSKQDCVAAVVEELVAKQIIPTIQTKAMP
jgi:hypothetical protein